MPQKLAAKLEAIESLLGALFAHRSLIPGGLKTTRPEWESEPSPLDGPPPEPYFPDPACDGRCPVCVARHRERGQRPACPPEEAWRRLQRRLWRDYRMSDVEHAFLALSDESIVRAQSVWSVWVEPQGGDWYNPDRHSLGYRNEPISLDDRIERADEAEEGLKWLAKNIRGYVRAYGEPVKDALIRQLILEEGYSIRRVKAEVRCGQGRIERVLAAYESAHRGQRTL